jgi:hypothetical protein
MLARGESIWRVGALDRKLFGLRQNSRPDTYLSVRCLSPPMERLLGSLRTDSGYGQGLC